MKYLQFSFFIILSTFGCQTKSVEKNVDDSNKEVINSSKLSLDFSSYLNLIPTAELPYKTACNSSYPNYPNINQELKNKFADGVTLPKLEHV